MPLNTSDTANASVEIDSTQLLSAAVSANCCASRGISGCTQYSSANVEKPQNSMARLMRLKRGLSAVAVLDTVVLLQ
jgi:hypothetical protein